MIRNDCQLLNYRQYFLQQPIRMWALANKNKSLNKWVRKNIF